MKVGIDLGTTTSTIARVLPDGRLDTQGPIPSIGAWRNGVFHFGYEAEEMLAGDELKTYPLRDLKLSLGRRDLKVGPLQVSTEQAVAELFRSLATRIAKGADIDEAVIGTPVRVDLAHRQALLAAARSAGFRNTRLVYEPTSALMGAAEIGQMDERSRVLVVDWGGGTLDIAVIRKDGNLLREVEVDGNVSTLGGAIMDDLIVREILERSPAIRRKLDSIDGGFERLKFEIEGMKIEILSAGFDEDDDEPRHIIPTWLREDVEIRPTDVLAVIRRLADEAREQIVRFLGVSRIATSDITHILFAGGVCNSAIVRDVISAEFRLARRIDTLKPQLLTGIGCARLIQRGFSLQLSSAFGIRQCDDSFCTMLPAGHDLGVGAFRTADFMVTDVLASEAVFDFGIQRQAEGVAEMISSPGQDFRSLGQLFVAAQDREGRLRGNVADLVRVYCGVDASLAVTVFAESNLTGKSATGAITGIPLSLRIGS